jgi:hypothetical protein
MQSTTGSLTANGSVSLTNLEPAQNETIVHISGTYGTVTLVLEATIDGTNWFGVAALSLALATLITGTISPADNSTVAWRVPTERFYGIRARVTGIVSGTVAIAIQSAAVTAPPYISYAKNS